VGLANAWSGTASGLVVLNLVSVVLEQRYRMSCREDTRKMAKEDDFKRAAMAGHIAGCRISGGHRVGQVWRVCDDNA